MERALERACFRFGPSGARIVAPCRSQPHEARHPRDPWPAGGIACARRDAQTAHSDRPSLRQGHRLHDRTSQRPSPLRQGRRLLDGPAQRSASPSLRQGNRLHDRPAQRQASSPLRQGDRLHDGPAQRQGRRPALRQGDRLLHWVTKRTSAKLTTPNGLGAASRASTPPAGKTRHGRGRGSPGRRPARAGRRARGSGPRRSR